MVYKLFRLQVLCFHLKTSKNLILNNIPMDNIDLLIWNEYNIFLDVCGFRYVYVILQL